MVSFSSFIVAFPVLAKALAAPTDALFTTDLSERTPDFEISPSSNLFKRQSYSQDYTTSGGSVSYSPGSGGEYSVTFSGAGDFVDGKGWTTGSTRCVPPPPLYPLDILKISEV